MRTLASLLSLFVLLGTVPHGARPHLGTFHLIVPAGSYLPGSRVQIAADGVSGPYALSVLGPGKIEGDTFVAASVTRPVWTTIVGTASAAVAYASIHTVPPPPPSARVIAVATYRSGIALHDERTFAPLGNIAIGGPPGDVAFLPGGAIVTMDTDGDTMTRVDRSPWNLSQIAGVPSGNEIATDASGAIFVTNRDVNGLGALTRILPAGTVSRVGTGVTAEGLALDIRSHVAYVGNVNDNSVAAVDMQTMRVLQKIPAGERPFGVALDERGHRLFVVSNISPSMNPRGGSVAAIPLARTGAVTRSGELRFPLGVAYDSASRRVFVTDEAANVVYVLRGDTLREAHAPLQTCSTPWRPRIFDGRLFVPCAREDRVDVFSLATLKRVRGAPFPTGGYPLSVAVWH
jgi:YVTN family beta-propeller protein